VPDVPIDESEKQISWNSTDEEGDDDGKDGDGDDNDNGVDGKEGDGDDDDEDDDGKEGYDDDDQEVKRDDEKDDEEDECSDDEQASDEEEFIHPSLSTHTEEETRDEESFDPIPKTPKNSDDEGNGEEDLDLNVGREEGHAEEEEEDELYRDININQGRGIQTTQEVKDSHVTLTPSDRLRDEAQADNDEFLKPIHENMQKIIKEQVKEQVKVQDSKILPRIEQTVNEQLEAEVLTRSSNSSKTSYAVAIDLFEMELKKILIEKMEGNKDVAMMMLIKTKNPPLDQTGGPRDIEKERSLKEPMQTTFKMEEPAYPEFETDVDDQPIVESSQHPEWFSQPQKPPTPNSDSNKTLLATHESIQPWISKLAKQSDSRSSFNELMDTLGSCKSLVELEYHLKEVYKATTDQLDWVNPEGASSHKYTTSVTKTKAADYGHIKWIEDLVPRPTWIQEPIDYDKHDLWGVSHWGHKRQQFYDFTVNWESARDVIVIQRHVENLQIGVESYQKKLNLTKPDTYHSDLKRKEAYVAYSNPRGSIYQNKDKKNMLIRIDELHKFNDGTLTDVCTTLDDRLKGIRM
nr:hypothetical protein [Tanacetum cinerariifolium]